MDYRRYACSVASGRVFFTKPHFLGSNGSLRECKFSHIGEFDAETAAALWPLAPAERRGYLEAWRAWGELTLFEFIELGLYINGTWLH